MRNDPGGAQLAAAPSPAQQSRLPLKEALSGGVVNAAVKFNPHLWSDDELRDVFVVRRNELRDILAHVSDADMATPAQHILICGHRGMGKSTLLHRLALEIRDSQELGEKWQVLRFPEEQYTVRTLAEFWLNVLDALADSMEQADAMAQTTKLDAAIAAIAAMPAAEAESAAVQLLADWIKQHQRGLVLLVDSSDQLFNSLHKGEPAAQKAGKGGEGGKGNRAGKKNGGVLWRLRHTLSQQPGLLWIGASYQTLESQHDYQAAFHDYFALHELRPLSLDEMSDALLALAKRFGIGRKFVGDEAVAEMQRLLAQRPERLQSLRLLSGGNPRTMTTLFDLFAAGGEDGVHADLRRLLDDMTPLYKARMEALSEQSRKVLAHLMEHWDPCGLSELTTASGLEKTTVSSQLARLENESLVEKAALAGAGKRNGYRVSERLFNIWYLMRYGARRLRQRLTWAIQFMRLWYSREELSHLASERMRSHSRGELCDRDSLEFSRATAAALGDNDPAAMALDWSVFNITNSAAHSRRALRNILPQLFDLEGGDARFRGADDYLRRFRALDAVLDACLHTPKNEKAAWRDLLKASLSLTLEEKERIAKEMAAPTTTAAQYAELSQHLNNDKEKQLARNTVGATAVLQAVLEGKFFPDCPQSDLALSQMDAHFGEDREAYLFSLELLQARHKDENLACAYSHALNLTADSSRLWFRYAYLLHVELKRYDEAEAAYRRAIELDENYAYPWHNLGALYTYHLKRYDEAEAAYRRAIEMDENFAAPWNNLGNLYADHLKRYDEAEAAFRRAIELDENDAFPWNNLGNLYADHLERYDEAEAAYHRAMEIDAKYPCPMANLARMQVSRGDASAAAVSYRQALACPQQHDFMQLQAHLFLGNRDQAAQALGSLAQAAVNDDAEAFFRLREQCVECDEIGIGAALAELMAASVYADFLQPFVLALRAAASGEEPRGAAPETLTLAGEVLDEIVARRKNTTTSSHGAKT